MLCAVVFYNTDLSREKDQYSAYSHHTRTHQHEHSIQEQYLFIYTKSVWTTTTSSYIRMLENMFSISEQAEAGGGISDRTYSEWA